MPAYKHRGKRLVYFGAWKQHCAVYALEGGTIRLERDEPLPESRLADLIARRLSEIEAPQPRRARSQSPTTDRE